MRKYYCAGFAFKDNKVALIKKNRGPANMAGRINAIGGKVENDETFVAAMVREFKEETGIVTRQQNWQLYCVLESTNKNENFWIVNFFKLNYNGDFDDLRSVTDEHVDWYNIDDILQYTDDYIMSNLKWLIPLALDKDNVTAVVLDPSIQ